MAAVVLEPAAGNQSGNVDPHAGAVLAGAADRPGGGAMDPAARKAWANSAGERARGDARMHVSAGHRQPFWGDDRDSTDGERFRADLSAGGREDRPSVSELSPGILQRHFLI